MQSSAACLARADDTLETRSTADAEVCFDIYMAVYRVERVRVCLALRPSPPPML